MEFPYIILGWRRAACCFDLGTGTIAGSNGAVGSIVPVGGGWYRCICASSIAIFYQVINIASTALMQYLGFVLSIPVVILYLFWGAQAETGAVATSYIPTTSAAVTRAADVAVMTGTNFSSWWNAIEGTFVLDVDLMSVDGQRTFYLWDGATDEMSVYQTSTPLNQWWIGYDGGVFAVERLYRKPSGPTI